MPCVILPSCLISTKTIWGMNICSGLQLSRPLDIQSNLGIPWLLHFIRSEAKQKSWDTNLIITTIADSTTWIFLQNVAINYFLFWVFFCFCFAVVVVIVKVICIFRITRYMYKEVYKRINDEYAWFAQKS